MTHSNQIITPTLLICLLSTGATVPHCASGIQLAFFEDVLARLRRDVPLRQPKVNNVEGISFLAGAHEEVLGLDVAVHVVHFVERLDAGDHLVGDPAEGLEGEALIAKIEQVCQGGTQEIQDEHVVVILIPKPVQFADPIKALQLAVQVGLVLEELVGDALSFQFDGHLVVCSDVDALVENAESPPAQLLLDPVPARNDNVSVPFGAMGHRALSDVFDGGS